MATAASQPSANAVYGNTTAPVALRIGTGGAGESGLLQALVEAFLASSVTFQFIKLKAETADTLPCCYSRDEDAAAEWYTTHTSDSIEYLHRGVVDIAITYHAVAELTAVEAGVVERIEYAWRDHWMLVGRQIVIDLDRA